MVVDVGGSGSAFLCNWLNQPLPLGLVGTIQCAQTLSEIPLATVEKS